MHASCSKNLFSLSLNVVRFSIHHKTTQIIYQRRIAKLRITKLLTNLHHILCSPPAVTTDPAVHAVTSTAVSTSRPLPHQLVDQRFVEKSQGTHHFMKILLRKWEVGAASYLNMCKHRTCIHTVQDNSNTNRAC